MFASTQWGVLLAASAATESAGSAARAAWEELYRAYCYPVYAFIRRRGYSRPQAQDLTQDFFVYLIESETLRRADASKGHFRTFLLRALECFLIDHLRRENASKRGGACRIVFLDDPDAAENDFQLAAPSSQTPDRMFDARWAAALVRAALARLSGQMAGDGKESIFEALKGYLTGEEDSSYQQTADALGLSLAALKSAIQRLRIRYGALLREEVARTVADSGDIESEVRHLLAALRP